MIPKSHTPSRYGNPRWVRTVRGGYFCWSCDIVRNKTGRIFSDERKKIISMGIRRAADSGWGKMQEWRLGNLITSVIYMRQIVPGNIRQHPLDI